MTDAIKISEDNTKVEITPSPIQQPKRTMATEMYVKGLKANKVRLQAQIDDIDAKLREITDAGVDTSKI